MNEEKRRIITWDWLFREFGPAMLELAGLTPQAEEARINGVNADWSAIGQAANALEAAKLAEKLSRNRLWKEAMIGVGRANRDACHLAGADIFEDADIFDEIASAPNYGEFMDAVSAATNVSVFPAALAAAAQTRGILPALWSLVSGSARKDAIQAAYEAAFARLRPTAEKLRRSTNELSLALERLN